MNVTKCENGHFFDLETFDKCPHCGAGVFTAGSKVKAKAEAEGSSMKIASKQQGRTEHESEEKNGKSKKMWRFHKAGKQEVKADEPPEEKVTGRDIITQDVVTSEKVLKGFDVPQTEEIFETEESAPPAPDTQSTQDALGAQTMPVTPSAMKKPEVSVPQTGRSGRQGTGANETEARNMDAHVQNPKPMKTIGVFQNLSNEPVTGWLVCIEGEMQGEAYNIIAGNNKIGRNMDMDIAIADPSVSAENQAILTFDPKSQTFFIKPGDGKALMYFNDEEEFFDERRKLKAFDRITIGNARFIFVPLCGENFNWKDYIKEE